MKFSIIFYTKWSTWKERWEIPGRSQGRGNYNQDILYEGKKSIFNKWEKFKSQDWGSVSRMKDFRRNLEGVSLDSQRKPDMLSQSSNLSPPDARWETETGNCSQSSYVGLRRPYLEGERKRQMCKLFSEFCYKILF